MKTVQMTLDEALVERVDRVRKQLQLSRSALTRDALREYLARHSLAELEKKHREGYQRHPVGSDEFAPWEDEQAWGEP
jgi:metal-responsive CopG/Arc/MetJ family transcriptional regulator